MILLVASIMGLPLPLVAIHLLRINLVTDGLPAIALGIDPINPTVMSQAPRSPSQGILNKQLIINIIVSALIMTS
jgi:Ca2+-transporting ATPase